MNTPRNSKSIASNFAGILRLVLLLGSAVYFFTHIDLTSLVFPCWNEPRRPECAQQTHVERQSPEPQPGTQPLPAQLQTEATVQAPPQTASGFYIYTDEQGTVHIVDDLDKVPHKFRKSMTVMQSNAPRADTTPVIIKGNQVLVPVRLTHHGRSVDAMLLLDTGASVTTINERLATWLGVASVETQSGTSRVADGRSIPSYGFKIDTIAVGPKTMASVETAILASSGGERHDGLLGMNFLKNYRYHVNFNHSVIEWGR